MKDNTAWMFCYNSKHNAPKEMSYVTADGNYGSDEVLVFPYDALTEAQWEILGEMGDYDKLPYVEAVLNGKDTEFLEEIGWDSEW